MTKKNRTIRVLGKRYEGKLLNPKAKKGFKALKRPVKPNPKIKMI